MKDSEIKAFISNKEVKDMTEEELVQHIIRFIKSTVIKYRTSQLDFEDFQQDCILVILEKFDKIKKAKFPIAYINRIINNTILNNIRCYYKHNKKENLVGDNTFIFDRKLKTSINFENLSTLNLSKLSEQEIYILELLHQGYKYVEIAEKLNVSKQRVEQIKRDIIKKLKEQ